MDENMIRMFDQFVAQAKQATSNPQSGTPTYGKPEYLTGEFGLPEWAALNDDERDEPEIAAVGWDLAGGLRLTFSAPATPGEQIRVFASISDYEQRNGVLDRTTDPATLRQYALQLLRLADAYEARQ